MAKDSIPAIPPVPANLPPAERQLLQAIKDALSVRAGQTKNRLDYSPTVRELQDVGLLSVSGNGRIELGNGVGPGGGGNPGGGTGGDRWNPELIPGAPKNFIVTASPWSHFLSWNIAIPTEDYYISHTEIWATTNNGETPPENDRTKAVLIATCAAETYVRPVFALAESYYWIRFVTYAGRFGAWSSAPDAGAHAVSGPDPETMLRLLTAKITEGELYNDLRSRIDHIDITDGGLIDRLAGEIADRLAGDASLDGRLAVLEEGVQSVTTFRNRFEDYDISDWSVGSGASLSAETTTVFLGAQSGLVRYTGSVPTPGTSGVYIELPTTFAVAYAGLSIEFYLFVRGAVANPASTAAIAYALSDGQTSGWEQFTVPYGSWQRVDVKFNVPAGSENKIHYLCILGDYEGTGKGIIVDEATTTLSLDLSGIATNAAAIQLLDSRVTEHDGTISANASEITVLKATVNDPNTGNLGLASNVSSNTARISSNESGITSLANRSTALETTVNNPTSGVVANSQAITNQTARVDVIDGKVTANSSNITTLNNTVTNNTNNISANAGAISGLTTRVTSAEGNISANAADITAIGVRIDGVDDDLSDAAAAIDILEVNVSEIDGKVTAVAQDLTQLTTTVDGNTASLVTQGTTIDGIQAKYTVKIDNNGFVSGYGLISEPNDSGEIVSEFGVNADTFWIGHPGIDYTQALLPFIVKGGKVWINEAGIATGTITSAMIKDAAITTAHIGTAVIADYHLGNGIISDAKIGNEIRSYTFDPGTGKGWRIQKNGKIEAAALRLYDYDGSIFLDAGTSAGSYYQRIDNKQQKFEEISGLPDSLDRLAIGSMSTGGYGNVRFEKTTITGTTTGIKILGNTFYPPGGAKLYDPNANNTTVEFRSKHGSKPYAPYSFLILSYTPVTARFTGYSKGVGTSDAFFLATYNMSTQSWTAWQGDGTKSWVYIPDPRDTLVASMELNTSAQTYTVYSFIAADITMPAGGNSFNPAFNLLYDANFEGLKNDGLTMSKKTWWESFNGTCTVQEVEGNPCVYIPPASTGCYFTQPTLSDWLWPRVTGGETLYFGLDIAFTSTTYSGGATWYKLAQYDKNRVAIPGYDNIELMSIQPTGHASFVKHTAAYKLHDKCMFIKVAVVNARNAGQPTAVVRSLFAGRSPTEITQVTAATYIRDAAIDTLQLRGAAVFVSTFAEGAGGDITELPATQFIQACVGSVSVPNSTTSTAVIVNCSVNLYVYHNDGSMRQTANNYTKWELQGRENGGPWVSLKIKTGRLPITGLAFRNNAEPSFSFLYYNDTQTLSFVYFPGSYTGTRVYDFRILVYGPQNGNTLNPFANDYASFGSPTIQISCGKR